MRWTHFKFNLYIWVWLKTLKRLKNIFILFHKKIYSTVHYIYIFTRLVTGSQRPIECNKVTLTCVRHINNKARGNKVTRHWKKYNDNLINLTVFDFIAILVIYHGLWIIQLINQCCVKRNSKKKVKDNLYIILYVNTFTGNQCWKNQQHHSQTIRFNVFVQNSLHCYMSLTFFDL